MSKMRILMLGNSYIFTNDMPKTLAELTEAERRPGSGFSRKNTLPGPAHPKRGGARLSEQLNPKTEMGVRTLKALAEEHWDYVVLQEMSNAPVTTRERFLATAAALCDKIYAVGATPVFYITWAYQKGGLQLEKSGLDYDEMYHDLQDAYRTAASNGNALIADVGTVFYERSRRKICMRMMAAIRMRQGQDWLQKQ